MVNQRGNVVAAGSDQIVSAADILRHGGLIAFPTETVYGLGGDATNDRAVAAIFAAKGRPSFNPLIVHVSSHEQARSLAEFSPAAMHLAEQFWPGPLTLVLPRTEHCPLSLLASAGLETIALRVPAHPVAQHLLAASGLAIAAPSANRSGHVSATTAQHVADDLGSAAHLVLDGGATQQGIESTIIGFDGELPLLLRSGAIPRAEIECVAGALNIPRSATVSSPGQLASHYAPKTPLRLEAQTVGTQEALLAFGTTSLKASVMCNLSQTGDLREAAANLFAMLRQLDHSGALRIAVMRIPSHGLGEAINDRLQRAAAPRDLP